MSTDLILPTAIISGLLTIACMAAIILILEAKKHK